MAALTTAYEKQFRQPRLEYVAQLAPAVEEVLINAGFRVEGHLPLMTCDLGSAQILPTPPGIELVLPASYADLLSTVTVQSEAYGDATPDPTAVNRLRNAGGIAVLARIAATGEPIGAGICISSP